MQGYPKPKKAPKPAVKIYRDLREVCTDTKAGRDEYQRRKKNAWLRDGKICPICKLKLRFEDSCADHISPRKMGGGARDDREFNLQAVHWGCNTAKGSRRNFDLDEEG